MFGVYYVEADSLEDALDQAIDAPLPSGVYVDESFAVDEAEAYVLDSRDSPPDVVSACNPD